MYSYNNLVEFSSLSYISNKIKLILVTGISGFTTSWQLVKMSYHYLMLIECY